MAADGFAHHGVFAHQHHSLATQGQTDGLHLLGAHIVCPHNETFWIVIQKLLQIEGIVLQTNLNTRLYICSIDAGVENRDT